MSAITLESVLTCPRCGFVKLETMPTDACQFYYECSNCKTLLRILFVWFGKVPVDPGTRKRAGRDARPALMPSVF